MKLAEIRNKAKGLGIKTGRMRKMELIHTIQKAEGNFDCFGKSGNSCDQFECCFRSDCLGG